MTVIATAANPRFSVSRVDIDRGGPTYTIDTLRDLADAEPRRRPVLHHRCRRAGLDPVVAELGGAVLPGPFRRGQPARLRARRQAHRRGHEGTARRRSDPGGGAGVGDLVERLPASVPSSPGPSGTWCPTVSCSTCPNATSTAPAAWRACSEPGTANRRHRHDRYRRSRRDGDRRRRAGRSRTSSATTSSSSTCPSSWSSPTASSSRRRPTSGRSTRSSTRSRSKMRAGRAQARPPRGHPRGALDAARLRRHRGARPAHRRARVLRAGPAVAGLPGRARRPGGRRRSAGRQVSVAGW